VASAYLFTLSIIISLKLLPTRSFINIFAKLDESLGLNTISFDISLGTSSNLWILDTTIGFIKRYELLFVGPLMAT